MSDTTFGVYLRRYRTAAGITATDLANRAGVHHTLVSRWEHHERFPTPDHVAAVCTAMNLNLYRTARLHLAAGYVPDAITRNDAAMKHVAAEITRMLDDDMEDVA